MTVGERLEVADVCPLHDQAFVVAVLLEVPLLARGEVVVDRDPDGSSAAEQPIDEVASEEAGAADDEPALARGHPRDSHTGALCCSAGWETRRWQMTEARPSVCGVTCSATSGGITTLASAAFFA